MKSRTDFVTNSSSSSYIISVKKSDNETVQKLLDKLTTAISHGEMSTKESVINYLEDRYCYGHQSLDDVMNHNEDEYEAKMIKEQYDKFMKAVESGDKIYQYSLEYDEDIYKNVFDAIEEAGLGTIIEEEG